MRFIWQDGTYTETLGIGSIRLSGVAEDIYDFRYEGPDKPARPAAMVQAGFGTLGNAGNLRLVEINLNEVFYEQYVLEVIKHGSVKPL